MTKQPKTRQEWYKDIAALEKRIAELNKNFEQYFNGFERLPPYREREMLKKDLFTIRARTTREVYAIKFRVNALFMRFSTFETLWERTLKQIENGTFQRDIKKAQKKKEQFEKQATEPQDTAKPKRPEPRKKSDELSDNLIKKIYDTYVLARRRTGESTKVSLSSLSSQLKERAATMAAKHGCERVDFKVVIKGGRALIKAQPKSE